MGDVLKKLEKIKEEVDRGKAELARLGGRESEILSRLKRDHNVGSLVEAKKLRKEMEAEVEKVEKALEKTVEELGNRIRGIEELE